MPLSKPTYHSRLFREFKSIPPDSQREIIRFYDENEKAILELEFEEYFDLLATYVEALFVVGKYRQHLLLVDVVIEKSIQQNIYFYRDQDLFFEMLTRKGLSLLRIRESAAAEEIFRQLIRINPERADILKYLKKSIHQRKTPFLQWTVAVSIGLIILTIGITLLDIILIRPFYEKYAGYFEMARNITAIFAVSVWALGLGLHAWQSWKKSEAIRDQALQNKGSGGKQTIKT